MRKTIAAAVLYGISALGVALAVWGWSEVAAGRDPVSIRLVLASVVGVVLPGLVTGALIHLARSSSVRRAQRRKVEVLQPDALVVSALATPEFVGSLDTLRAQYGLPRLTERRRPLTVSVRTSGIDVWQAARSPEHVMTIPAGQIMSIGTRTCEGGHDAKGQAGVRYECVTVTTQRGGRAIELPIPALAHEERPTTHAEVGDIADLFVVKLAR